MLGDIERFARAPRSNQQADRAFVGAEPRLRDAHAQIAERDTPAPGLEQRDRAAILVERAGAPRRLEGRGICLAGLRLRFRIIERVSDRDRGGSGPHGRTRIAERDRRARERCACGCTLTAVSQRVGGTHGRVEQDGGDGRSALGEFESRERAEEFNAGVLEGAVIQRERLHDVRSRLGIS